MWEIHNNENGQTWSLSAGSITLGRSRDNNIILSGEGVSRQHALLEKTTNGWLIRDLGSSNGTFVNNQRVQTRLLHDGDRIGLGQNCSLRINGEPQPQTPTPSTSSSHNSSTSMGTVIAVLLTVLLAGGALYKALDGGQKISQVYSLANKMQQIKENNVSGGNSTRQKSTPTQQNDSFADQLPGKWVTVEFKGHPVMTAKQFRVELEIHRDMTANVLAIRKRPGREDREDRSTAVIKGNIIDIAKGSTGTLRIEGGRLYLHDKSVGVTMIMKKTL